MRIGVICWSIWKSRCAVVFEGRSFCPKSTIDSAKRLVVEALEVASGDILLPKMVIPLDAQGLRWRPPSQSVHKLNIDAVWEKHTLLAGLGDVIRDGEGNFVRGGGGTRLTSSVIEVEAHAALRGLSLANEVGCTRLEVESDSKELILSVKGNIQKGSWILYPILVAIREKCKFFHFCSWRWIPQQANKAADAATEDVKRRMCNEVWVDRLHLPWFFFFNVMDYLVLQRCRFLRLGIDMRL